MFGVDDPRLIEWMNERITPQPVHVINGPVWFDNIEGQKIPRTYIDCTSRKDADELKKNGGIIYRCRRDMMR